jgi:FtsP/CotA-like multicopper oxidase with cupredoxin domain
MANRHKRNDHDEKAGRSGVTRRTFIKSGVAVAGMAGFVLAGAEMKGLVGADTPLTDATTSGPTYIEAFPTSPLIVAPFTDPLPIPKALRPIPKSEWQTWASPPSPDAGKQDSDGATHQVWGSKFGYPDPLVYQIKLQVAQHNFTSSPVQPIGSDGKPVALPAGTGVTPNSDGTVSLPPSTIYGFNGTFPGPMINAEYGQPALVRFENHLDENPLGLDRQDFGAPDRAFLTHLHNGHTAPESDGNPHYRMRQTKALGTYGSEGIGGYKPKSWVDNLYLNYPAGGDDREKQSFMWFHDHRMDHTSANVYKGMVGLFPIYDPKTPQNNNGFDGGDETKGLHLPGVRTDNADGSFDVKYDIPLAFYDCRLEDGTTPHKDFHNGNGELHPEWWGKTFFRHFPNHGFVGDIFTVNGTASPVLNVERRKYRLRFLDASISRIYEFKLMRSSSAPKSAASLGYAANELQGQYRLPGGAQCMKFVQIASEGGLLPAPITRDSFELWPAKRREVVVDFSKYMDGTPTHTGDVIYLTNVMKMTTGRQPDSFDSNYKIPMIKIVIGEDPVAVDNSQVPTALRTAPAVPSGAELATLIANRRVFQLERGSTALSPEIEWLINGMPFMPDHVAAQPKLGSTEVWEIKNGGGGWVHPLHLHMEEHHVVSRNGKVSPDTRHPDDTGKEDVVALDGSESVLLVRRFRDFTGAYVGHCHNLAHEDHAMMFGWEIVK